MHRVGLEGDVADPADAARVILAFEIAFQHQVVVAQHDKPMQIPDAFICDGFVEPRFEKGGILDGLAADFWAEIELAVGTKR